MNSTPKMNALRGEDGAWRGPLVHRTVAKIGIALFLVSLAALLGTECARIIDSDEDTIPGVIRNGYLLTKISLLLGILFLVVGGVCEFIANFFHHRELRTEELRRIDELSGRSRFERGKKVYKHVRRMIGSRGAE